MEIFKNALLGKKTEEAKSNENNERLPVKQEHLVPEGALVACMAYLFNKNYNDTLSLFMIGFNIGNTVFTSNDVELAFKAIGKRCFWTTVGTYNVTQVNRLLMETTQIPNTIIQVINKSKYPREHYLVKTKDGFLDPWINYPSQNPEAGLRADLPGLPRLTLRVFRPAPVFGVGGLGI